MGDAMRFAAIVIGTSAGGIEALKTVLQKIKHPLKLPIVIVQHLSPRHESYLPSILASVTGHNIKEAEEKERLENGWIYIAPPNFHVLIEKDGTLSLTVDKRVAYARPSIDVLFETAADAYRDKLIGVILTGANHDGASGMKCIKDMGGYTIVQNPETAYASEMPKSALELITPDAILAIEEIGTRIDELMDYELGTALEIQND